MYIEIPNHFEAFRSLTLSFAGSSTQHVAAHAARGNNRARDLELVLADVFADKLNQSLKLRAGEVRLADKRSEYFPAGSLFYVVDALLFPTVRQI